MDPFTEKLLERTRARRENLQKKMAERPNAANRQMVKRPREPLGETNSVVSQSAIDQVPQVSTKPSPSKRKCSGENLQPTAGEENQEPTGTHPVVPLLPNPPTDKKPPLGPASGWASSSSAQEKAPLQPTVQPEPPTTVPASSNDVQMEAVTNTAEEPKSSAAGMKSRLQKLAEYRKCWDGDGSSEAAEIGTPLPMLRREAEAPPAVSVVPSGTPVGRRGRLANLAATIGSWEDDLSHANIPKENTKEKATAPPVRFQVKETPAASNSKQTVPASSQAAGSESATRCNQAAHTFVTSSKVVPPSPQKVNTPTSNPLSQSSAPSQASTVQATTLSSAPQKIGSAVSSSSSSSSSVPQSPLKIKTPSKSPNIACGPQKPVLSAKPTTAPGQAPAVKSFLERFEERCQDRTNQSSPAGVAFQTRTPSGTPSITPNTRLMQERLRATQAANTTTAELTQKQKLERESELALIRSRFQKGNNIWRDNTRPQDLKTNPESKIDRKTSDPQKSKEQEDGPAESDPASQESASKDESVAPPEGGVATPSKSATAGLVMSPPASTSSPLKMASLNPKSCAAETSEDSQGKEVVTEMSVDQSINSAVINELFEGVLEQSDDPSEDEEDVLNISSMSILTPLAETVAAVVKSPDRGVMTSTPANSFIAKDSPDDVSRSSRFQRPHMIQGASCSSVEASDDNLRLPYSIDAYRSTRVKDTERPSVKQVIVRKEDVSQRAEEPRGSSVFSIKQKMKILKNEMNLQQTVIHQASQALNCCTDEEHGKGSQVEAEAERLLLVATEKREALKAELDRLSGHLTAQEKRPAAQQPAAACASKGSITVQELRLPLKADFVCSSANRPEATKHSFFIILRAGALNTVATPLASTHSGLSGDTLPFSTKFTVSDVSSDFEIDVEVYCLVQKRELCSDKKKKAIKSKAITPKRFLAITKSAQTPVVASPGGPNAVRTSNFILVGLHKLNLSSLGKNKFPLEKVPFLCPLEGHVFLKLQCEVGSKVEERGFLTMFEDVSGFGAWHRRWCVLSGYYISYWTYPDDEKRKNPIGRINLASCTSKAVEPANREFCARPNTFELITARPQREDDKETLVSQCKNTMCVTKNWLSADTKDERNLWMKKLNQIVTDLRMWQPDACSRSQ